MKRVYEDDFGIIRCCGCGAELLCDGNGDMPEVCLNCGEELKWSIYDALRFNRHLMKEDEKTWSEW